MTSHDIPVSSVNLFRLDISGWRVGTVTCHDIPVSSVTLFMSGYFKTESWYCDLP